MQNISQLNMPGEDPFGGILTGTSQGYQYQQYSPIDAMMRRMQRSSRLVQRAQSGVDYGQTMGDIANAFGGEDRFNRLLQVDGAGHDQRVLGRTTQDEILAALNKGATSFGDTAKGIYQQATNLKGFYDKRDANMQAAGVGGDPNGVNAYYAAQDRRRLDTMTGFGQIADLSSQLFEGAQGNGQVQNANNILRQSVQQGQSISGLYQGQAGAAAEGSAIAAQNTQMKLALSPGLMALGDANSAHGSLTENTAGLNNAYALGTGGLLGLPTSNNPLNGLRPNNPQPARMGALAQIQAINTGNTSRKVI